MEQIYWITRLDAVKILLSVIIIFSCIGIAITIIGQATNQSDIYSTDYDEVKKRCEKWVLIFKKTRTRICYILPIVCLMDVFIPSQSDAYMIYGLGGTIDYLKESPAAKQLPEKTLQLLNKWEDSQIEQLNKQTEENKNGNLH